MPFQKPKGVLMEFQRIASKSVTDSIAKAMENADKMKKCVIIYEVTEEIEAAENITYGVIVPEDQTLEAINYLLDVGKRWVFDA
jgi:hypothetical protein